MPEWAQGFWQCKLRYKTQDELLSVAREYKKRGLPLSIIVTDFFHWTLQGDWKFDPACWPDPDAMVRELDQMGFKLMVSIWPTVNENSENFQAMKENGLLVRTVKAVWPRVPSLITNPPAPSSPISTTPPTPLPKNSSGAKCGITITKKASKSGGWTPVNRNSPKENEPGSLLYHLGSGQEVGNLYPHSNQRTFFEGMQAEKETEYVMLCRSAWAGSQRFGAAVWSGDILSTFEALQAQVPCRSQHRLERNPLVDHRYRRFLQRQYQYALFQGTHRPLVPVRRFLPHLPSPRLPRTAHPGLASPHF